MHAVVMVFCLALAQGPPLEIYAQGTLTQTASPGVAPLGNDGVTDFGADLGLGQDLATDMPEILKVNDGDVHALNLDLLIETGASDLVSALPQNVVTANISQTGQPYNHHAPIEVAVLRCPLGTSNPNRISYNGDGRREVAFAFGGDVSA